MCLLKSEKSTLSVYTIFMWMVESSVQVRVRVYKRGRVTETEKPIVTFSECSKRASEVGTIVIPFY